MSPGDHSYVDAGVVIEASLDVQPGLDRNDPGALAFVAIPDGGPAESGSLNLIDAGLYAGGWAPALTTTYALIASWPDAGISSSPVQVTVVRTPPVFQVQVPLPSRPGPLYQDPQYPNAWRRDEFVPISITSTDAIVDPTTVQAVIFGIADGGPSPIPWAFNTTAQSGCDARYCGVAQVDLAAPEMSAFDGQFQLIAVGRDLAGNPGATPPDAGITIDVTRWKWLYDGGQFPGPVAVGQTGRTYSALADRVVALDPDGGLIWAWFPDAGAPGCIALGVDPSSGTDRLYAIAGTTNPPATDVFVITDTQLAPRPVVQHAGVAPYPYKLVQSQLTVGASFPLGHNQGVETAFVELTDTVVAIRPDAPGDEIRDLMLPSTQLLGNGATLIVIDPDGGSSRVDLGAQNQQTTVWARSFSRPLAALQEWPDTAIVALAVDNGGADVFFVDPDSGIAVVHPFSADAGNSLPLLDGPDHRLTVINVPPGLNGIETVSAYDVDGGAAPPFFAPAGNVVSASMGWGQGDLLYVIDTVGLTALSSDFLPVWTTSYQTAMPYVSPPSFDCTRDEFGVVLGGRPGVMYVPRRDGIWSVVVDGRGLNTRSSWPVMLHDSHLSNNAGQALAGYKCP